MQTQLNILKCDILVECTSSGQCRIDSDRMIDKIILTMPKILLKTLSVTWRVFKVVVLGLIEESSHNQQGSGYTRYKSTDFPHIL